MIPTRPSLSRHVVILLIYFLLALTFTYPLVSHLSTHIPGHVTDGPTQTWSLWWVPYSIFNLETSPLYSDYVFYPLGINLVGYTPTFLNGLISIPLQFNFGVILAQNLLVFFALAAGGYGTFLLTGEILARHKMDAERRRRTEVAAALAGAFYAFGAWHLNYVVAGHFMLLSNEWIPFYALYLTRLDRTSWRNGALAGFFFIFTAWTELTFVPFLALLTALYLTYLLLGMRAKVELNSISTSSRVRARSMVRNLAVLIIIGAVGISPLAVSLLADILRYGYYLTSGVGRIQIFSAEPISFFIPSAQHPLLGAWAAQVTNANTSYAFVGYAALILAACGFYFYRVSHEARFWAIVAMLCALMMLGPTLIVGSQTTGIPLPFAALRAIPFVNANRYPVRFNVMLMLALAVLIALGAARLLQTARGRMALGGLVLLLAFEQLVLPIPLTDLRAPAIFQMIRDQPGDFSVLDLPLGWRGSVALQGQQDARAQFYQTIHHKRILGGITSRIPPFKLQYFLEAPVINSLIALESGRDVDEARRALDRTGAPQVLRFFNIRYVNVQRALTPPPLLGYVQDLFPLQEIYRDDARIIYRVALDAPSRGTIDLNDESARLYFDDGWGRPQSAGDGTAYRWATMREAHLWLPLVPSDQEITFRLRAPRASQKIVVRANDHLVAEWNVVPTWSDFSARVTGAMLRDGLNEFAFSTDPVNISATRQDDYTIGTTGVVSPVDIAATGAGFYAGRFGEIFVAGHNVIQNTRGYHLVALDARSGKIDAVGAFDTFKDAAESERLAQFVQQLPRAEIVAGVAIDDVSNALQANAVDALHSIGVAEDLRSQFRTGHAFIGVKGAQTGQGLEDVEARFPASVAVGKAVDSDQVSFALGGVSWQPLAK